MLTNIEEHYEAFFGSHTHTRVDLAENTPVDILVFPPAEQRPVYTLATRGLSRKKQKTPAGKEQFQHVELLVYLPDDWEIDFDNNELPSTWACKFLHHAARYIIDKDTFLGDGSALHTEDDRHPTFFLYPYAILTYPLMESPDFFPFDADGLHVEFLSPMLITQAEADFGKANGPAALIKAMIDKNTFESVWKPLRPCTFEGDPRRQVSGLKSGPKTRSQPAAKPAKPVNPAAAERQAARQEQEILAVAQAAQKKGCIISTAVFLVVAFLVGSDWWDKTMPMGSGIILFLAVVIVGILAPFRYAKIKAKEFSSQVSDS